MVLSSPHSSNDKPRLYLLLCSSFPEFGTMISLKPCKTCYCPLQFLPKTCKVTIPKTQTKMGAGRRKLGVRGCTGNGEAEKRTFLSLEEAGLVEISGLSTHEKFLCRLTISSLNLMRVISEQEGCEIEELNAGKLCDWFLKDRLKREQNIGSAVLQWDDSDFQI